MADVSSVFNRCRHCNNVCMSDYCSNACMWKLRFKNTASPHSPPLDVVEAARQTTKRFGELDGEAWKDVQAVCEWVLSHEAIDK